MTPIPELDLAALGPLIVVAVGAVLVLAGELLLDSGPNIERPASRERIGSALALLSAGILAATLAVACDGFLRGDVLHFNAARPPPASVGRSPCQASSAQSPRPKPILT